MKKKLIVQLKIQVKHYTLPTHFNESEMKNVDCGCLQFWKELVLTRPLVPTYLPCISKLLIPF